MMDHHLSSDRSDDAVRAAIVGSALDWLGTPYRHQGRTRGVGCDCLGLLLGIWRDLYGDPPVAPPNYSRDWITGGDDDPLTDAAKQLMCRVDVQKARPGHILLFRWKPAQPARHCAVLAPDQTIIHAYERTGVVRSVLVPAWNRRITAAFAFPK